MVVRRWSHPFGAVSNCRLLDDPRIAMSHPFRVVFHFPAESPLTIADIEDDIAEALGNETDDPSADHMVDGNEIGKAIDIFVATCDPNAALELCRPMLERMGLLDTVVVAWRPADGGAFSVIHPPGFAGQFTP
jgi:hypothetical protein